MQTLEENFLNDHYILTKMNKQFASTKQEGRKLKNPAKVKKEFL